MYKLWQRVKHFVRPLFGSEDTFSYAKENVLLAYGLLFNMPIVYRHQLPVLLNYLRKEGEGVEIGIRDGAYSEILLSYSTLSKLYSVDPWREFDMAMYNDASNVSQDKQDKLHAFTVARLLKFKKRSVILRMTSREAAKRFNDGSLDFIYIDANHSYGAVKEDLELWWPKLKKGGIFAGHDYVDGYIKPQGLFGVKRAVNEFVRVHKQRVYSTPENWPTWYLIKNNSLRRRMVFFRHLRREIRAQFQNITLWRQTRGINLSIKQ